VQLEEPATAAAKAPAVRPPVDHTPSFWGRLVIGLVLAQGLYYGLRALCNATVVAFGDASEWWASFAGLITDQSLEGIALMVGGVVAGAGQPRGALAGTLLGSANAVLLLVVHAVLGQHIDDLMLYGQPLLHASVGALGGAVASRIWRPLPAAGAFAPPKPSSLLIKPTAPPAPFAWGRILLGVAIAVGGTVWAHTIRTFMTKASQGALRVESQLQTQFITWEISTMSILVGAALAGATTRNGTKQGVAVGVLAGAGIVAAHILLGRDQYPAQEFLLEQVGVGTIKGQMTGQMASLLVMNAFFLSVVGGWFGGQLMPPAGPPKRRLAPPD
jgi:hypothetical protein